MSVDKREQRRMRFNITNTKRFIFKLMIAALLVTGVGCKKKASDKDEQTTQSNAPEGTLISIYHPEDSDIVVESERYQLKQPDSTAASIEEIMAVIAPCYEDKLLYKTYMLDSNNVVTLEFEMVEEYTKEYYLLAKASIIRTLYQIDDISLIRITIYSDDEKVVSEEELDRDSILYYDEETGE